MTCTDRTLGRKPGCDADMQAAMEAIHGSLAGYPGTVYFVDRNHAEASDQHAGTDPDFPLATVGAALAKTTAYTGDAILVMHNSYWTYADVTQGRALPVQESVIITTPGIRLIGVSPSTIGVPWIPTALNSVDIIVDAMDVTIEGFCFWQTGVGGTTGIHARWDSTSGYYGENLTVRRCFFFNRAYGIRLDYAYNCVVEDCRFDGCAAALQNPSVYGEPDYLIARNNYFVDNTLAISLGAVDHCIIEHNYIQGTAGGTNNMIDLTGGADNWVSENRLSCTVAQYDTTCSDSTSGSWGGNQCQNGVTAAAPV